MEKLHLSRLKSGNISLEKNGQTAAVTAMLAEAMTKDMELQIIVCGALPSALDALGLSRQKFADEYLFQTPGLGKTSQQPVKFSLFCTVSEKDEFIKQMRSVAGCFFDKIEKVENDLYEISFSVGTVAIAVNIAITAGAWLKENRPNF